MKYIWFNRAALTYMEVLIILDKKICVVETSFWGKQNIHCLWTAVILHMGGRDKKIERLRLAVSIKSDTLLKAQTNQNKPKIL